MEGCRKGAPGVVSLSVIINQIHGAMVLNDEGRKEGKKAEGRKGEEKMRRVLDEDYPPPSGGVKSDDANKWY